MSAPAAPPAVHVLSNGRLTTLVTAGGGGRTTFGPLALTRWVPDRTSDADGPALYVRDEDTGAAWRLRPHGAVRFAPGVADWRCEAHGVEARVVVAVASAADAELRRVTLVNRSDRPRRLSLTTYGEAVLTMPAADAAHPAFAKLFVQTEWDAAHATLLARRRPRSPDDLPLWAAHRLWRQGADASDAVTCETDRMRFVGRGRTVDQPRALDADARLTGTVGNVLDPVLALRRTVALDPGTSARFVAVLAAGDSRAAAHDAAARFATGGPALHAVDDACAGATARADALLAALGVTSDEAAALPHALGTLLFAHPAAGDMTAWRAAGDDRALLERALRLVRDGSVGRSPDRIEVPDVTPRRAARAHAADPTGATDTLGGRDEPLLFFNGHGGFTTDGREYVVRLAPGPAGPQRPPLPWTNVVANARVGCIASESGAGCTWSANSRENRLTPWFNDPVCDPHGEALWLRDDEAGVFWSPTPGPTPGPGRYEARHGLGYTRWRHASHALAQEVTLFVAREDPVKLVRLRVTNRGDRPRRLTVAAYAQWVLGGLAWETASTVRTRVADGAVFAEHPSNGEFAPMVAFAALVAPEGVTCTADRAAFLGHGGSVADPAALRAGAPLDGRAGAGLDPCAAFAAPVAVAPGETVECTFVLGQGDDAAEARALVERYRDPAVVARALAEVTDHWRTLVAGVQIQTPAPALDLVVNGWLAYQNLSCRMLGRSAFYQSGGAFGFRDQLQDASAMLWLDPAATRRQIVLHAAHQFPEGDVLHWWHPPTSKGIRTRFADDLLWLPYVAAAYVAATGDASVLDEPAGFVTARLLADGEDEAFVVPGRTGRQATVYEHCCLAIERSLAVGVHGLPLMGVGDWNDGMNRVGREGRGESVWMGFFLAHVIDRFAPLGEARGDRARAARWRAHADRLARACNADDAGWDGAWYRRAYYDDGTPLGASASDECRIDALAQAWAVISGVASPERAAGALDAMERHLVSERDGIVRLLAPAFDRTPHDPGYIKGYLPGVRENGGQYTHAALWAVKALAELGRTERAARLLEMLSPVSHARTPEEVAVYQAEPYVVAADVYGVAPHVGRGGWTWYTGSAGWMFRVAVESVLGLTLHEGRELRLRPCVPEAWPGFTVRYRLPDGRTTYALVVERAAPGARTTVETAGQASGDGAASECVQDGAVVVPLRADGGAHRVRIALGTDVGPRYRTRGMGAATEEQDLRQDESRTRAG